MSNEISNQTPTMSSREIADLVDTTHDSVLKTVRGLVDRGVVSGNETPYRHPQNGQSYPEFLLTFRDTMVVVSGYSPELRARIIDRWQELEAAASQPVHVLPKSFSEALRELATTVERVEQQQVIIDAMKPKAEFHDAVTNATNCQDMQAVAKVLGTGRTRLFRFLRDRKILQDNNRPYQRFEDAGYFEVKERVFRTPDGESHTDTTTLVTGKGLAYIQKLLNPPAPPAATAH